MKNLFFGIFIGLLLAGCISFSYRYYGIQVASFDGKLLGPTPADDRDFKECQNNNCVIMLSADFFALKQDYMDTKQKLVDCQSK